MDGCCKDDTTSNGGCCRDDTTSDGGCCGGGEEAASTRAEARYETHQA